MYLLAACLQKQLGWQTDCSLKATVPGKSCAAAGSIELLAARSLALLRSLTEYEQKPFLDQASEAPATKELARHTATRATHFAGLLFHCYPQSPHITTARAFQYQSGSSCVCIVSFI